MNNLLTVFEDIFLDNYQLNGKQCIMKYTGPISYGRNIDIYVEGKHIMCCMNDEWYYYPRRIDVYDNID